MGGVAGLGWCCRFRGWNPRTDVRGCSAGMRCLVHRRRVRALARMDRLTIGPQVANLPHNGPALACDRHGSLHNVSGRRSFFRSRFDIRRI
jgi:hypothetical protein